MSDSINKTGTYSLQYGVLLGIITMFFNLMLFILDQHYQGGSLANFVNSLIMIFLFQNLPLKPKNQLIMKALITPQLNLKFPGLHILITLVNLNQLILQVELINSKINIQNSKSNYSILSLYTFLSLIRLIGLIGKFFTFFLTNLVV